MKTLLTLFVLFFASSLVADTDLIGKKLLCSIDPEEVENYAFNFIDKNKVKIYNSYPDEAIGETIVEFESHPTLIRIKFVRGRDEIQKKLTIDRKTLIFDRNISSTNISSFGKCEIVDGDDYELFKKLVDLIDEQIKELKKDNKI